MSRMTSSAKKEVDPRVMLGTFKSSYVEELKTKDLTMTAKFREASDHALEARERFR
jgi:hypothetical protein